MAVLTDAEVEALRAHLRYGNLGIGAYPYTPDGYYELFYDVIAENLTIGAETTATTAIVADTIAVVTPASMTGIVVNGRIVVDVADDAETVVVKAATATTFTARFTKAHSSAGYPVAVESGLTRLRMLLYRADAAWQEMIGKRVLSNGGIKSLAREEIVWFGPYSVLRSLRDAYLAIVCEIASLIRVDPADGCCSAGPTRTEAY